MKETRDATSSSVWVAVHQVTLPSKKYFKIGEVSQLVNVEPHVLRYWQTQFPQVRPHKSRSGHRMYRKRDVETLLAIRELLHVQRFTIAGARQALRALIRGETLPPVAAITTEGQDPNVLSPDVSVELVAVQNSAEAHQRAEVQRLGGQDQIVEVDAKIGRDETRDDEKSAPQGAQAASSNVQHEAGKNGSDPVASNVQRSTVPASAVLGLRRGDRELLSSAKAEAEKILALLDQYDEKALSIFA